MSKKNMKNWKNKKKNQFKQGSKEFLETGDTTGGCNDPAWWMGNDQLARDAANVSFGNVAGLNINFQPENGDIKQQAVPGIMTLNYVPIIGISKDGNSAVNNASRLLFTYIRHANSGSKIYEQSDLFTYVVAVSNMLTAHAHLVRLYGLARTYSKMNRYIGKSLIESLGFNYDDVIANLASLRYGINALATRINSFAIPLQMHVFARHITLASHIFKDSQEVKSQLYAFKPVQYFQWSAEDAEGKPGSCLKPIRPVGYNTIGTATVQDALTQLSDMIDALSVNEDCGTMSGDILKGMGDNGVYHVNPIPEDYVVEPTYDQVILGQIHNASITTLADRSLESNASWITQDSNNIIYDPLVEADFSVKETGLEGARNIRQILDAGMDNPSTEYLMEITRLKTNVQADPDDVLGHFTSTGTEVITGVNIYTMRNGILILDTAVEPYINSEDAKVTQLAAKFVFDWAPIQYIIDSTSGFTYVLPCGELFNYTIIDGQYIDKVNNVALLSALNVYSLAMSKAK